MRRMAQGDEASVRLAYQTYADTLYRFILRRLRGSVEDAEEIVNDVFVLAIRYGAGFEGRCSALTWLCSLARGCISDRRRAEASVRRIPRERVMAIEDESKRLLRKVHDPSLTPDLLAEQLDRVQLVQALLDTLTPDQREAVVLRYVEGFSVIEIAHLLKRSSKAVERLLERAKERPRHEIYLWFAEDSFRTLCLGLLTL